ncbi:MAG: spore cortex biosynthesis protein YabQ [Eubacteriales bacterium]
MSPPIGQQGIAFLCAVALGMAVGLYYDCFRILRRGRRNPTALVAVEDLLFWLVAALATMALFYVTNSMELRGFLLLGEGMGWGLWQLTFSRPLVRGGSWVLDLTGNLLFRFLRWLIRPVVWMLRPLIRQGKQLLAKVKRVVHALGCKLRFWWNSKKIAFKSVKKRKFTCGKDKKQIK